jgi:hypothetical protein
MLCSIISISIYHKLVLTSLATWSDPIFMEEIKHLKIETTTDLFPKFMRMQENVFDSCMSFYFFACTNVGWGRTRQPDLGCELVRRPGPGRRSGRPGFPLTI